MMDMDQGIQIHQGPSHSDSRAELTGNSTEMRR
jgi:hypothetical protein